MTINYCLLVLQNKYLIDPCNNKIFNILVMIGIVTGSCKKGNKAIFACCSHQCSHTALMCKNIDCECQKDHSQCQNRSDFPTLLKKIYTKKTNNFDKIQSVSQWYQNASRKIIEYRDKLFQQANQCILKSLGPFEGKLLRYIQNSQEKSIYPSLIIEAQQSLQNNEHQNRFEENYKQTLMFAEKMLSALESIPEALVSSGARPLHIKTLTGRTTDLYVPMTETVGYLKKMLKIEEGYQVNQQRLVYAGIQLNDDVPLFKYNLRGGETIHVVLTLYGE